MMDLGREWWDLLVMEIVGLNMFDIFEVPRVPYENYWQLPQACKSWIRS